MGNIKFAFNKQYKKMDFLLEGIKVGEVQDVTMKNNEIITKVKELASQLNIPVTQVYVILLNIALHSENDFFNSMSKLIKK